MITGGDRVFAAGDIVLYDRSGAGSAFDVGCIKSLSGNGAFVAYHLGDTCAFTPYERLLPIGNAYALLGLVQRSQQLGRRYEGLTEGCETWPSVI